MIDFNNILDDSIILCHNQIKDSLVEAYSKDHYNKRIKFISKEELLAGFYPSMDYKALIYLKNKYNYSLSLAYEIFNNIKYLKNIDYNSLFLNELKKIKEDLEEQGYLTYNKLYSYLFKNRVLYLYGYSNDDQELISVLNDNQIKYEFIIDNNDINNKVAYSFNNMEEEIISAFNYIYDLIDNGVELNQIYLYKPSPDYLSYLKKQAFYAGLPIEFKNNNKLDKSNIFLEYLKIYQDNKELVASYEELIKLDLVDEYDAVSSLTNLIMEIKDLDLDYETNLELLTFLAKERSLKTIHYTNSIKIIDYNYQLKDDEYCLLLGFNLYSYPNVKLDNDFFSDKEKEELGINTSLIYNKLEYNSLTNFILKNKNVYLSYRLNNKDKKCSPSTIIMNNDNIVEEKGEVGDYRVGSVNTRIEIATKYDLLDKYGINNPNLVTFTKEELGYKSFENQFSGLLDYKMSDETSLSYTSIDSYYTCPFKYYLQYVLKIDPYEEGFSQAYGKLAHKVLEDTNNGIKVDLEKRIENKFELEKEKVFARNLAGQLDEIIKLNEGFLKHTEFKLPKNEKRIDLTFEDENGNLVKLNGTIDKILINEDNGKLIVIDYKTYDLKFEEKKVEYGLNLQLPIYSLLVNEEFGNDDESVVVGLYIQNICSNPHAKKKADYRLSGYTLRSIDNFHQIDDSIEPGTTSNYVKGVKINKDGALPAPSKQTVSLKEEEFFTSISDKAKEKVIEAYNKIKNGDFVIYPAVINNINDSCKYCQHQDVCFVKVADYHYINLNEEEGEENEA